MRGVSDDMESLSDPAMYGQYNSLCAPNKGGWIPANRNINMDLGGQSLYRTVSAKQLTTSPSDTIFHSQSMPDSMYLEGNYSKLDIPKFKRARSVDVGTGGMINATSLSLEQGQGVRQNISIPQGVEVYDHSDLHWSTVNSIAPSSMGHSQGQQHFSYTTEGLEQFPYHLPKQQLQHQVPSHIPMHQYVDFPLPADISSRPLPFERKAPFHFAMPSLLPVLKMANLPDSSLPTAVTSNGKASAMTQPYETSADAFGTDLGFNGDFGFDHDLAFSAFCATSETVISTPAYPPCRVDGCEADSSHRSPFCVVHPAGGRRCQQEGCNKCAQVTTLSLSVPT